MEPEGLFRTWASEFRRHSFRSGQTATLSRMARVTPSLQVELDPGSETEPCPPMPLVQPRSAAETGRQRGRDLVGELTVASARRFGTGDRG